MQNKYHDQNDTTMAPLSSTRPKDEGDVLPRLNNKQMYFIDRLQDVNEALELLNKRPELADAERFQNLLKKIF